MKHRDNLPLADLPLVGVIEDKPTTRPLSLEDLERASVFGKRIAMIERARRAMGFQGTRPDPTLKVELLIKCAGSPIAVTVPQSQVKEILDKAEEISKAALKQMGINV